MVEVAICIAVGLLPIAVAEVSLRRRRARRRRERMERLIREDIAWSSWCDAASRSVREGKPVFPWKEPS